MKLSSIFRLYKSCYPSASAYRVTVSATGGLIRVSDFRHSFRLSLFSMQTPGNVPLGGNAEYNAAASEFAADNRRELFMLREARCLYGIVYAENLECDLRLMSLTSQNATLPQCGCERLKLTYLLALADALTHTRYSQDSVTLERGGNAIITAGTFENRCAIKVEAGGKVSIARKGGGNRQKPQTAAQPRDTHGCFGGTTRNGLQTSPQEGGTCFEGGESVRACSDAVPRNPAAKCHAAFAALD